MTFTTQQIEQMAAPLSAERVAHRSQAGKQLSYIETWDAMEAANRIWGYDGWCYSLDRLEHQAGVWVAIVTVTVYAGDRLVTRQDAGAAIPAAKRGEEPSPEATETALKGAVSDATKRALRSFGGQFGLLLYDKDAPEHDARPQSPTPLREVRRPPAPAGAPSERSSSAPGAARSETRPCPTCDGAMTLRSGTTREGRPYTAYFCDAKCGNKPIWLPDAPAAPTPEDAAPDAAVQLLGDVRGPQLAARLRAALGAQGFDGDEQAAWITRQIAASGKSGLPAFTLADGKALLERAANAAAPVAAERSN